MSFFAAEALHDLQTRGYEAGTSDSKEKSADLYNYSEKIIPSLESVQ